ncbi:MAG: hypothetical protein QOG65_164 [Actinomycetota bacterium]|nr:hypothetical protein [Actinomycetota bacterium]
MASGNGRRLVAVYETRDAALAAAEAARNAGVPADDVRVDEELDRVASIQGEMRQEIEHTVLGPGNVGPFTKEMAQGMTLGAVVGAVIGVVVALPFAAFSFAGWPLWLRLVLVAIVGGALGSTVGWIVGGGFGARRPDAPLAAQRGVTVTAPALDAVQTALIAAAPIRIDLVADDGHALGVVTTDESGPSAPRRIGRHLADEEHED